MTLLKGTIHCNILEVIAEHASRITSRDLEKIMVQRFIIERREFQAALRALVADGNLTYTYLYGCTFIEKSFNRPVRVGSRVILTPPEHHPALEGSDIAVMIRPGASFGGGQHPSTRLAIQGIEYAIKTLGVCENIPNTTLLDIGTGTGVLAISALKMGIHRAIGTDIDPCSIAEAGENAQINGLSERFAVLDVPAEEINGDFHLIAANLRYPTLARLCPYMTAHISENGAVILSGIREEETKELKNSMPDRTWNAGGKHLNTGGQDSF